MQGGILGKGAVVRIEGLKSFIFPRDSNIP